MQQNNGFKLAGTPESAQLPDWVATPAPASGVSGIGIAAVAQEIGLTKDTLRVWERRYGFPQPIRSRGGERLYRQEQVMELRLIKRLLDAGHRPSKVLGQSIDALQHLAESSGVGQDAPDSELDHLLELLRLNSFDDFRFALLKRGTRYELEKFVLDVAAPLSTRVGNAWAAGSLQVHHEHLFSESLQNYRARCAHRCVRLPMRSSGAAGARACCSRPCPANGTASAS
ncbi:MerR family transcriptional regulator [Caballeronia jiangsuensis]|uniref:MerR family transcriptional regulator n=1 Tax=Caballeronia jiangsuensis TaxID=1458357 RepID=A0ABW9CZQ7_9BURK